MFASRIRWVAVTMIAVASSAYGQTWSSTVPKAQAHALRAAPAGFAWSVVRTGGSVDVALTRVDAAGQALFTRSPSGAAALWDVAAFPDGSAWWFGRGEYSAERFDTSGQSMETIATSADLTPASIEQMIQTADGGLALVGWGWHGPEVADTGVAARFRPDGSLDWCFSYAEPGVFSRPTQFNDVIELPDASLVVCGRNENASFVAQLLPDGTPGWVAKVLSPDGSPAYAASIELALDGSLLVCWPRYDAGIPTTLLANVDTLGNVSWARAVAGVATLDSARTASGNWLLAGFQLNANVDSILYEVDTNGALVRALTWSVAHQDRLVSVDTVGSDVLLAGSFDTSKNGPISAVLERVNARGAGIPCSATEVGLPMTDVALVLGPPAPFARNVASAVRTPSTASPVEPGLDWMPGCFGALGVPFCSPNQPNSSGVPAVLTVRGSDNAETNSVRLLAADMPAQKFGYFLVGMGTGVVQPPGAQRNLCLDGATIGRFVEHVSSTGGNGKFSLKVDLTNLPAHGPVQAGETWGFQAWFRDTNPGSTSNFTDSTRVLFR